MKKLIVFMLLMVAIGAKAQSLIKVKTYLGDSVWAVKGAKILTPIIVEATGDTARSAIWCIGPISRDSTSNTSINVLFYNKSGGLIYTKYLNVSESAYTKWSGLFTAIDNYLHNQISRIVLH